MMLWDMLIRMTCVKWSQQALQKVVSIIPRLVYSSNLSWPVCSASPPVAGVWQTCEAARLLAAQCLTSQVVADVISHNIR